MKWTQSLNESFLGACPRRQGLVNLGDTDTGRCVCHAWRRCTRLPWQPRRAWSKNWCEGMAAGKGSCNDPAMAKLKIGKYWQPLNTSCVGYPILSDVIRFYGMFWVAVSATHCKWILHSSQAGPRSPSVVHVSSWLTNPSCLIPGYPWQRMHTSGTDCQGARSRSETDKASAPGQLYTFSLASHELLQDASSWPTPTLWLCTDNLDSIHRS